MAGGEQLPTSDNEYASNMAQRAGQAKDATKDVANIGKAIAEGGENPIQDAKAGFALLKWIPRICTCSSLFYVSMFAGLIFFVYYAGGGLTDNANADELAAGCGQVSAAQTPPAPSSCSFTSKNASSNGYYYLTSFGCNIGFPKDPSDNCQQACPAILGKIIMSNGSVVTPNTSSGEAYESSVKWYSANADEYGCNSTLKVTNPKTGQAAIVKAIDRGPSCKVMSKGLKFDVSQATSKAIGGPNIVKVEKVADGTPLGPVSACTADGGLNRLVDDIQKYINKYNI